MKSSHRVSHAESICDVLAWRARNHPERIAYVFVPVDGVSDATLTYGDLYRKSLSIAAHLSNQILSNEKTGGGKTALLMYPAGLDFIAGFFGCLYAGLIAVPIYPPRSNRHLARLLAVVHDATPTVALTQSDAETKIRDFMSGHDLLADIPLVATDSVSETPVAHWNPPALDPDAVAMLQYTSGSTAAPKGVMLTHRCIMASQRSIANAAAHDESMVMASWLPIYHDMGLFGGLLQSLTVGGKTCFTSPTLFLQNPTLWLEIISSYQATDMVGPNFGYALCCGSNGEHAVSLSSIKTAWNGAEPIRADVLTNFTEKYRAHGWRHEMHFPCYGMAEATLMVTAHRTGTSPTILIVDAARLEQGYAEITKNADSAKVRHLVSSGIPHDETEIRIINPATLEPCAENVVGEIWIAGPGVGAGYWRKPDDTEKTFRARTAQGEGPFLRTGDLGFLHEGDLYVTGRLKDMVIIRGRNIYPQDVERRLEQVLGIVGPNTVGVFAWDDGQEEKLAAVIECSRAMARNGNTQLPDLTARMREAVMEEFEVALHTVAFLRPGTFARTSSGKVQRGLCRKRLLHQELEIVYADGLPSRRNEPVESADAPVETLADHIAVIVIDWLKTERGFQGSTIDRDATFSALGVDSLGGAQIAVAIEAATGLTCKPEELYDNQSVNALAGYLSRHGRPAIPKAPTIGKQASEAVQRLETSGTRNHDPLARYRERNARVNQYKKDDRYFFAPNITEQSGTWVAVDGKRMANFASYNYLGLLKNDRIQKAAHDAVRNYGTGNHGARLLAGTNDIHHALETKLARFLNADDSIVFLSGYVTNVSAITALIGPGDAVIGDELNHASIVDACRFTGAAFHEFQHNNMDSLRNCLKQVGNAHALVVVDGLYSMEGDIAPIPDIVELCRAHGALLMVDEAHSIGVLGKTGHGVQEHFGLPHDAIDVKMGTLSKSLSSAGGFVAGNEELITFLRHNARGYVFSVAMPPPQAAAAHAALDILETEPERVARLWANRERFTSGLKQLGFHTFGSETPIVPIATHTEEQTLDMTKYCRDNGLFVVPVFYPAVPMNAPRLRTCVMASHTDEDIDFALEVLSRAGKECHVIT
ncbi:MAG TPA: aminotransferase class I/II-fold pyridoxal phosphate-dependent enzyme [Kiritimatiellia bacterium]|nr:aminotransferase class I/II-fold pyridoxal phosphate-dependent enzyme [Kiritimatiellia bacterium]